MFGAGSRDVGIPPCWSAFSRPASGPTEAFRTSSVLADRSAFGRRFNCLRIRLGALGFSRRQGSGVIAGEKRIYQQLASAYVSFRYIDVTSARQVASQNPCGGTDIHAAKCSRQRWWYALSLLDLLFRSRSPTSTRTGTPVTRSTAPSVPARTLRYQSHKHT